MQNPMVQLLVPAESIVSAKSITHQPDPAVNRLTHRCGRPTLSAMPAADTGMFTPATDEIEITSETGSANASFSDIMEMIRTIGSVTLQGVGTVVGLSQNGQAQLANGTQTTLNPQGTYTVRGDRSEERRGGKEG